MMKTKNSKRNAKRNINIALSDLSFLSNPPQYSASLTLGFTQRYIIEGSGGVANRQITNLDLFDSRCFATGATAAYRTLAAIKLKSVEMWCSNTPAVSGSNSLVCEWYNTNPYSGSSSKMYTDSSLGMANIAHVLATPPKNGFSGEWLPNIFGSEYPILELTGPIGTIIDLKMSFQFILDEAPVLVTGTVVAATTGQMYLRHLDSTNASPTIFPIGGLVI